MLPKSEADSVRDNLLERITPTTDVIVSRFGSALDAASISELEAQLQQDAIQHGEEVFFPSLALLSAAGNIGLSREGLLAKLDLEQLAQLWETAFDLRSDALQLALTRILRFAASQNAKVSNITLLDGDPHNCGNRPVAFVLAFSNQKARYVYKPVPATTHNIYDVVATRVCADLDIRPISAPVLYDGGDYCIRSFVPSRNRLSSDDLSRYYYAFGALIAVAMLLEMTDLHFENIVVYGDAPVMIDTEFVLPPKDPRRAKWSFVTSGLFAHEISPLNQVSEYSKIKGRIQREHSHYRYRFARAEVYDLHIARDLEGNATKPNGFSNLIEQGARDVSRIIKKRSSDILEACDPWLGERFSCRQLLRNTSLYKIMQMRLWAPSPMRFADREEHVRAILHRGRSLHTAGLGSTQIEHLVERELVALRRGDIPYFWADSSNTLFDSDVIVARGFGKGLAKDRLRTRLARMVGRNPSFKLKSVFSSQMQLQERR